VGEHDVTTTAELQVLHSALGNNSFRQAQELLWGKAGVWAYDIFEELNEEYFADEVPMRGIAWGLTPHGGHLGHCQQSGRITLHPALLDPRSDAWRLERYLGEGYARDVLLHEMIHALLFERVVKHDHNTQPWCDEVMRLAPLLGLGQILAAPVLPRQVEGKVCRLQFDGHLSRREMASFPHSLRPKSWYEANRGRLPILL
jgi:hypothetical protein